MWKDNAIGITVDRTMNVDFAKLKTTYVVIDCGTGFDPSPTWGEQYEKAKAAGLGVLAQYQPISAIDGYVFERPAQDQIEVLEKILGTRAINGLVISMERWWIGWDMEEGRNPIRSATNTAIAYTAKEFLHTFKKLGHKVLLRSNDGFVQKHSPDMASFSDLFPFFLADWRYRLRDANGQYTVYKYFPAQQIESLSDLFFPPEEAKNPLIPGFAPQLKFWEFNGSVDMGIKGWDGRSKKVKVSAFNGPEEDACKYLGIAPKTDPDIPPSDTGSEPGSDELLRQIAADVHTIASMLRPRGAV